MDITQLYIQQKFGDIKPWYSETDSIQGVITGSTNVIQGNFTNEKVKVIVCTNIWICYNSAISPVQITDVFGNKIFETPAAPATDTQLMGMFPFDYIIDGSAMRFIANKANFKFTIYFTKVKYKFKQFVEVIKG